MTSPSPDRAPDEIERPKRQYGEWGEGCPHCSCTVGFCTCEADDLRKENAELLATLRETRRELAALKEISNSSIPIIDALECDNCFALAPLDGETRLGEVCGCGWGSFRLVRVYGAALTARAGEPATQTEEPNGA